LGSLPCPPNVDLFVSFLFPPLREEAGSVRGARLTPVMEGGGVRRGLKPMERVNID